MSSSSSEASSSPAPNRKRKQAEVESSGSDDDRDSDVRDSDSPDSDAGNSDQEDSDAPQPLSLGDDDVPVLSHAERRRQKKKQKQLAATASSPRKKIKLEDGTAADPTPNEKTRTNSKAKLKSDSTSEDPRHQKRQNSVWVGNMSFRTTPDALRRFFEGAGEITRIHMPMRRGKQLQGENMGFAYVDFATSDAKVVAISLSEGHLDGRKLLIKDGNDFTGRPAKLSVSEGAAGGAEDGSTTKTSAEGTTQSKTAQKILRNQKQPPAPTLFLGNLGFETTEASIRELFEAHRYSRHKDKGKGVGQDGVKEGEGEEKSKDVWIRKIRMGTFEDSGNCKGFAFVDFTSIEHATEALVNPRNHRLNGRDLVVEYASPDAVRRSGGHRNPKPERKTMGGAGRMPQRGSEGSSYPPKRRSQPVKQGNGEDIAEAQAEANHTPRSQRPDRSGHDRSHGRRSKPGAALAQAQRQSAAILPSQGQKIVF